MSELLQKILISVGSTVALAALSLLFKSVRNALFYKRVDYDLPCERPSNAPPFTSVWDIHWEDYRLTFEAGDISDDKIRNVKFEKLGGKTETVSELFPSDTFRHLFQGEIQIKLNSIVRHKPATGNRVYTLRMVFRRRRLPWPKAR
jgi:hypothetical protein